MRSYDLTPLYRNAVGFDRVFDLLDNLGKVDTGGYPPYNIERLGDDDYRITLAVAGFSEDEIEIVSHENTLIITGKRADTDGERAYLYQGIAGRSFERRFQLAEHVKVEGASLTNGLLNIELKREVPEAMKPKKIAINGDAGKIRVLKSKDAA
jgi:molecular chaperone IbpA